MRVKAFWRTTTVRLTLVYVLAFTLGVAALVGLIYLRSTVYLMERVDTVLRTEADGLAHWPTAELPRRIDEALALNGPRINIFALFSPDGHWLAGNIRALPTGLPLDDTSIETPPSPEFRASARMIARRLASGDELVVGRDVTQLHEIRAIMSSALVWAGLAIILMGLGSGAALSVGPLRRLRLMEAAAQDIAGGDLKRRMPTGHRGDELDLVAGAVNYMMGEVERLMNEVKGATETIAHDLRTPLTRARAQLHRLKLAGAYSEDDIVRVIAEIDAVLERFRALMRISELEARERHAGFSQVDLSEVVRQAVDLYQPLAEAQGVRLDLGEARPATVEADPKLLFEAVSNLVDNAIKFTAEERREQGRIVVGLGSAGAAPQIVVQDNGPGIAEAERPAVLQRFYRGEDKRLIAGSGLGLSIVAAIVRLHRFNLVLQDGNPGLRAVIICEPTSESFANRLSET